MIAEGLALVEKALLRGKLGPYQTQAAMAAVHASAADYESTNWHELVLLYDSLLRHRPNPVVRLNRTVAVAKAHGARAGLALLRELEAEPALADYPAFFSVRGHLCSETGDVPGAVAALTRALALTSTPPQRESLQRLLDRLRLN